ncbi:Glycosyltransferase involved in cell wall bisynthesis [Hyunsoonleella jejuensis]|uniref:Glycosyltransferase involved in cell wall bisynthesis n=1 Tax=Hyunsoonleella jejuensis TaxID=419940 RepID=A0A1H9G7B8_9FLAO|nr:glycosyltransferase [Hyunsoonleella jejuensis]SEQ45920.1 Glycosyltransferase involved in cell wall bisynthesis [Hyunsoonleella jejuensis]
MAKRKKIVFVLPDFTSGGAERVMSFVAQNVSKHNFEVSLWAAGFKKNTTYNLDGLDVTYFNKDRVLKAIPCFFNSIRKTKPDIVISSIGHVNTVMGFLSLLFPKTKFVGRVSNVISVRSNYLNDNEKTFFSRLPLSRFGYKFLDIILCQSRDMFDDMKLNYNIPDAKLKIINNPISDGFKFNDREWKKGDTIKFITVARLKKQKGHERIVNVLSKLDLNYKYTIIGDGPEKEPLFDKIKAYGIEDKVIHIPFTKNVAEYLQKSDFFLQGSYVEGFPNSLIESCAVGTPVIAFKAPGGLNEIIENGINGLISNDETEYLENIHKAVSEIQWNLKKVSESVNIKFNKETIIKNYEDFFNSI